MNQPIIGLNELANWGPQGATAPGGTLEASRLPRSYVGLPVATFSVDGTGATIPVKVQREMRPDRLVMHGVRENGDLTYAFKVRDVRVGVIGLNSGVEPIPGEVFAPYAVGVCIRSPVTAVPSVGMEVIVEDVDVAAEDTTVICGAFFGPSAAPGAGAGGPMQVSPGGEVGAIIGRDDGGDVPQEASSLPQTWAGIPETDLTLGVRTYITVKLLRDIRPDRLIFATQNLSSLLVNDIKVGVISLNASANPAPAVAFAPMSFGTRLRAMATATPSVGITLEMTSLRAGLSIAGAFFGPSRYATT